MGKSPLLYILAWAVAGLAVARLRTQEGEDFRTQPRDEWPKQQAAPSPYILYGPHGYKTFPHSRCQEVPTADVELGEIEGDWFLQEYVNSHDGKPTGAPQPYLCPEARMSFMPNMSSNSMNVSQISYEWPVTFLDVVEWTQHPKKSGVFFHEENIFSLWTMKVMEFDARKHMAVFLCIDYTKIIVIQYSFRIMEALATTECRIMEALAVMECRIKGALVALECRIKESLLAALVCRITESLVCSITEALVAMECRITVALAA